MGKTIRKRSRSCNFFFVRPGKNQNLNRTAERLMNIAQVKEVHITEGNFGFVVKAESADSLDDDLNRKISKATDGELSEIVSCIQFCK